MNRSCSILRAFTLVELLVVVAIITALLAILSPAVGRAVFNARVAVCASQQKQWSTALIGYASDAFGALPTLNHYSGGRNPSNIAIGVYDALHKTYGLSDPRLFFCPLLDRDNKAHLVQFMPNFYDIGYGYWVPRSNGVVYPYSGYAAQTKLGSPTFDPLGQPIPLLTDNLQVFPASTHTPDSHDFHPIWGRQHEFRGSMANGNLMFVDGHVENRTVDQWRMRYLSGNSYVWY